MPRRVPTFRPSWLPKAGDKRPSSSQRGYGSAAWRRTRLLVIARDAGVCQICGLLVSTSGDGRDAHVDHIIEKVRGGTDALENLRLCCRSCHSRRHARGAEPSE